MSDPLTRSQPYMNYEKKLLVEKVDRNKGRGNRNQENNNHRKEKDNIVVDHRLESINVFKK